MQARTIVLDANILIRAILGTRMREPICLHYFKTAAYQTAR